MLLSRLPVFRRSAAVASGASVSSGPSNAALRRASLPLSLLIAPALLHAGDGPWASRVVAYDPGVGASAGFTMPAAALGEPTRFTGVGLFPGVVSPFNPAYLPGEIVSIGAGGELIVELAAPATDDPSNRFGVDLILFGNTGFIDAAFPFAIVGGVFSDDGGAVELSADGISWSLVPGAIADGLMPTLGYLDSGAFDNEPGEVPSDFTRAVDPALTVEDLLFLEYDALLEIYDGSGGGAGVDIARAGLDTVRFVRISVAPESRLSVEVDAISIVSPALGPDADLDGDGSVDGADLGLLLGAWGGSGPADLDGNGVVDGADLGLLLGAWS